MEVVDDEILELQSHDAIPSIQALKRSELKRATIKDIKDFRWIDSVGSAIPETRAFRKRQLIHDKVQRSTTDI